MNLWASRHVPIGQFSKHGDPSPRLHYDRDLIRHFANLRREESVMQGKHDEGVR